MATRRVFRDKIVVITGAAGGMGRALSHRFGRAGAKLGLMDLDEKGLHALERELGLQGIEAFGLSLDITDEEACRKAMTLVKERYGGIDVLVNNAGITHRSPFALTEAEVYRRVIAVNFFGSLYCTQAVLGELVRSQGLIIVMSSISGFAPLLGRTGYAASKHALHGLFDSLRAELQGTGVDVTIVCPGFTATNIEKNALAGDGRPASHPRTKVGRVAAPEQVADAVFRSAARGQRLLVLSRVGRLSRLITRFFPSIYENLMVRSLRPELERSLAALRDLPPLSEAIPPKEKKEGLK